MAPWEQELSPQEEELIEELVKLLGFIAEEVEAKGEDQIPIPATLKRFVKNNLRAWIENAYVAKFMKDDDQYIVGDAESQKEGEIVIMDKLTGVEQNSSKWSKALHLFLQFKHNAKLSDESLKAVFMSNMTFFKKYDLLYGMSGTVGGEKERQIMRDTYDVDFFELPRFRPYRFELDTEAFSVAATEAEWLQNIANNVDEIMDQQRLAQHHILIGWGVWIEGIEHWDLSGLHSGNNVFCKVLECSGVPFQAWGFKASEVFSGHVLPTSRTSERYINKRGSEVSSNRKLCIRGLLQQKAI